MPVQEILPGKLACCKRIEDLEVKDQQKDCQDPIFRDEPFFIDKEEQRQDHCYKNAGDCQDGEKIQGHGELVVEPANLIRKAWV
jgi:hypothetical protein